MRSRRERFGHTRIRGASSVTCNYLEGMLGRDGIEPPTPGFSGLGPGSRKCAQRLAGQGRSPYVVVAPARKNGPECAGDGHDLGTPFPGAGPRTRRIDSGELRPRILWKTSPALALRWCTRPIIAASRFRRGAQPLNRRPGCSSRSERTPLGESRDLRCRSARDRRDDAGRQPS